MEPSLIKNVLEAALFAAREPMFTTDMKKMFDEELSTDILRKLLDQLREEWADRPVELINSLPVGVSGRVLNICPIWNA